MKYVTIIYLKHNIDLYIKTQAYTIFSKTTRKYTRKREKHELVLVFALEKSFLQRVSSVLIRA